MDNYQIRTLKAKGRVNSPSALDRIQAVHSFLAEIHDGCLYQYKLAEQHHPTRFHRFSQQKDLTELRANSPEFKNLNRRLQEAVIQQVAISWQRYLKAKNKGEKAGRPRYKNGRYRTISLNSPPGKVVQFTKEGNAVLRIHTLPAIRLLTTQDLPTDQQPVAVRITLKGKRISVRLSYRFPLPEPNKPEDSVKPLGLDLGIALSVATSTGQSYISPKQEYLERQVVKERRKLSQVITAAVATGRAGNRAILDDFDKQVLSRKDRPMRQLIWTNGTPTKSYLKARRRLSNLIERLTSMRTDFRHQTTTAIIAQAVEQHFDLLALEDLQVANMSHSARGTMEKPGRNVRAKSGLNRSILREAWGETLTTLEYKAERAGIPSVRVNAQGTSITCNCCGHRDPKSRESQAQFTCTGCGYQANADYNASVNTADRGLLYYRKRHGLTIESLRLARAT